MDSEPVSPLGYIMLGGSIGWILCAAAMEWRLRGFPFTRVCVTHQTIHGCYECMKETRRQRRDHHLNHNPYINTMLEMEVGRHAEL
jgi:hypothetical protein